MALGIPAGPAPAVSLVRGCARVAGVFLMIQVGSGSYLLHDGGGQVCL